MEEIKRKKTPKNYMKKNENQKINCENWRNQRKIILKNQWKNWRKQ